MVKHKVRRHRRLVHGHRVMVAQHMRASRNRARGERLARPLDTRTAATARVSRVIGYVEYLLTVHATAPTMAEAESKASRYGRVRDVFTANDPDGTRHATAIAESVVHGFEALQRATEGIDRFFVPSTPGAPHMVDGTRAEFLRDAKKRPAWFRDARTWRDATKE